MEELNIQCKCGQIMNENDFRQHFSRCKEFKNNFKEDKEQELRDKIKTTILITAIAVTPAAIIHKIDQIKIDAMMAYYETVIEEEKEKSYMQGFLDGLFGPEENYLVPVDEVKDNIIETNTTADNTNATHRYVKINKKKGLSAGSIVAIAVSSVVAVASVAAAAILCKPNIAQGVKPIDNSSTLHAIKI